MKKLIIFFAFCVIIGSFVLLMVTSIRVNNEKQTISEEKTDSYRKIENVVLIIACSLRADHLGCYGYERDTSPNIDQLAKGGILFKNCFSQAPYTVHSVASIMTAKYPRKLFGLKYDFTIPDQAKTFAEVLKENGFYTLGFMANPWTSKPFNFHQGFDYYFDTSDLINQHETLLKRLDNRVWGATLTEQIAGKIKGVRDNFFLQVMYVDIHWPYTSFPPYRGKYTIDEQEDTSINSSRLDYDVNRYDESILNFDSHIGKLVETLRKLNMLESTLIIITADHGDAFRKYHQYDLSHGHFLYNTVIRSPLIFYNPNLPMRGVTIDNYVALMDILPTTLDLMEISYDRGKFDGNSQKEFFDKLVPSKRPERFIVSETNFLKKDKGMRRSCIVWDQHWKLVRNYQTNVGKIKIPVYELYDLKKDPNETNNLFKQKKKIAGKLILLLQDWQKENTTTLANNITDEKITLETIDPEIKSQLEALGYIK